MSSVKKAKLDYKVLNQEGEQVKTLELNGDVFGAKVRPHLVHAVVRWQLAARRAGTHSVLNRKDIQGGGKKPWKQKGTGRARAGSSVGPLWVGGAVAHGPKPRKYIHKLSAKVRRAALASVLSHKVAEQRLIVLDSLEIKSGKTKDFCKVLNKLGVNKSGVLLLVDSSKGLAVRAASNETKTKTLPIAGVNVYDLMRHKYLLASVDMIAGLEQRVLGSK